MTCLAAGPTVQASSVGFQSSSPSERSVHARWSVNISMKSIISRSVSARFPATRRDYGGLRLPATGPARPHGRRTPGAPARSQVKGSGRDRGPARRTARYPVAEVVLDPLGDGVEQWRTPARVDLLAQRRRAEQVGEALAVEPLDHRVPACVPSRSTKSSSCSSPDMAGAPGPRRAGGRRHRSRPSSTAGWHPWARPSARRPRSRPGSRGTVPYHCTHRVLRSSQRAGASMAGRIASRARSATAMNGPTSRLPVADSGLCA